MEPLRPTAETSVSTYKSHLINSLSDVVVHCVGLFGHLTYYAMIFISVVI